MPEAKFRFTVTCFAVALASCGSDGSGGTANNIAADDQPNGVATSNVGAATGTAPPAEPIPPGPPISNSDTGDPAPIAPPPASQPRTPPATQADQPPPATEDEYIRSEKQTDSTPPPHR